MNNKLQMLLWTVLGCATIVLFAFGMQKSRHAQLTGIHIEIEGAEQHVFADERQIQQVLQNNGAGVGMDPAVLDLHALEHLIEDNAWIKKAELYIDNRHVLQVKLTEREAVARVFTLAGTSFYVDSSLKRLPINNNLSANVPVFTSFPSDRPKLSLPDSGLLAQVKTLAMFIESDSVWQAQVAQVDIQPDATFELIPALGDHVVTIGNTDSLQQKFDRLLSFYRNVWAKYGMEKYERIDVQYANQIVATRRGHYKSYVDSAKARQVLDASLQLMHAQNIGDSFKAEHLSPLERKDTVNSKPVVKPAEKKPTVVKEEKKAPVIKEEKKLTDNSKTTEKKTTEKKTVEKATKKEEGKKEESRKETRKPEAARPAEKKTTKEEAAKKTAGTVKDTKPSGKQDAKKTSKPKKVSEGAYSL
jgi:cell division protein FtsQ